MGSVVGASLVFMGDGGVLQVRVGRASEEEADCSNFKEEDKRCPILLLGRRGHGNDAIVIEKF